MEEEVYLLAKNASMDFNQFPGHAIGKMTERLLLVAWRQPQRCTKRPFLNSNFDGLYCEFPIHSIFVMLQVEANG